MRANGKMEFRPSLYYQSAFLVIFNNVKILTALYTLQVVKFISVDAQIQNMVDLPKKPCSKNSFTPHNQNGYWRKSKIYIKIGN